MMTTEAAKRAAKSRTMWLAVALAVTGAIQMQTSVFNLYMTPEMQGLATMLLGVVVAVLRVLTTVPLEER